MGAFKLGKMTFGSLFKKPETVLYPLETKAQPEGLKGHIGIDVDACILCGMCDKSCSTDCITVDKDAGFWQIDRYACVQCGYCVTVCLKKCLHMMPDYAAAATNRNAERIMVIMDPKQDKAKKPAPEAKAKQPEKEKTAPQEKAPVKETAPAGAPDEQVERLVALLDEDKASKVRAALQD